MERNITSTANRHVYSYQPSINNQTDFTSISNNLNNFIQSQTSQIVNNRINSTENANLIEILQSATDDSKIDESSSNNNDKIYNNDLESEFNVDQTSSMYQDYSSGNEFSNEDLFDSRYKSFKCRASTAPTKAKNEAEEFKYSSQYALLEKLSHTSSALNLKSDGKFDLDSEEGTEMFKIFLERLELLIKVSYLFYFSI